MNFYNSMNKLIHRLMLSVNENLFVAQQYEMSLTPQYVNNRNNDLGEGIHSFIDLFIRSVYCTHIVLYFIVLSYIPDI